MSKTFIYLLILVFPISLMSQNFRSLSDAEKEQIAKLEEMAQLYMNENDIKSAGQTYSKIAFLYWKVERPREAIDNFRNSSDLFLQIDQYVEVKSIYSNIGIIYTDMEELELALEYFEKSLVIRRKIGDKDIISAGLIDVAYMLQIIGFYDDAIKKLNEALKLATETDNSQLILNCYEQLSLNYNYTNNLKKSDENANKAESFRVFLKKEDFKAEVSEIQQEVVKTQLEKDLAAKVFALQQELYLQQTDSLSSTIRTKQDSLLQSAQRAKKRQLEIKNLNQQKMLQDLEIEQQEIQAQNQKLVIYMVVGGLVLMFFLAIIMLRANRARKRVNTKLENQNREIAEKSEQLSGAFKKIEHQNQNITQSINYAKSIQQALLPKPKQLNNYIEESFIFFKPRDIVSGDYYWFREVDARSDIFKIFNLHRQKEDNKVKKREAKKFIVSAIDCTGHGVPGAFMSMIGYNLLDEISNKGITRPDLILEELHRGVRFTLKQKETNNQDGMDMAICVIDREKKIMEYAGAKNPLIYVQNDEIVQIKGSKDGIGGKSDNHKFTNHSIDVSKPTWVYIFSDGYIDQFGGDQGRKFLIKNFREMLFKIYKKPMSEQKEYLNKVLADWIGTEHSQIDDILVMGFKIEL